jgi:hypothetical protein
MDPPVIRLSPARASTAFKSRQKFRRGQRGVIRRVSLDASRFD